MLTIQKLPFVTFRLICETELNQMNFITNELKQASE